MSSTDKQAAEAHYRVSVRLRANAGLVARVAPFMARGDIRYYLNGVAMQKAPSGGIYIVATDGHRLAVAHDTAGSLDGAESVIVSLPPATLKACKPPRTHGFNGLKMDYVLCIEGDRLRVGWAEAGKQIAQAAETHVQPGCNWLVEGKFPSWRNLIPPDWTVLKPSITSDVQARYIEEMARAGYTSGERFASPIRFWQKEPTGAIFVQYPNTPELLGVVMPMRNGTPDDELHARLSKHFKHESQS